MSTAAIDDELLLRCLERRLIAAHVADDLRERGGVAAALVHDLGLAVETVVEMLGELGADFGTIDGWRLLLPLGSGSAAQVFLAERDGVRRALKLVHVQDAADAARLEREVAAGLGFDHPHVLKLHGTGTWRGAPYLLLDHCPGGDCERLLRRRGALPATEVLAILRDAAIGVEAIHAAGLIHRDLKPANLLRDADGRIVVADLGLARDRDQRLTLTGAVLGTPAYLAPEQAQGASDLDQRCDVWALGACAFALACGRPPFTGATPWETVARVVREEPPDPHTVRADLPGPLRTIIRTCMVRDPEGRYASAAEIAEDCTAALAGEPLRHAVTYRRSQADTPSPLAPEPKQAPTWLRFAAAIALPGILGVLLGWWFAHPGSDNGGTAELAQLRRELASVTYPAVDEDDERERRALTRDIAVEERLIANLEATRAPQPVPTPPAAPIQPLPEPILVTKAPAMTAPPEPAPVKPSVESQTAATPPPTPPTVPEPTPEPPPPAIPLLLSRCDVIRQEPDMLIGFNTATIVIQRVGENEREIVLPWAPRDQGFRQGSIRDLERCREDAIWYVPLQSVGTAVIGFLSPDAGATWKPLSIPITKAELEPSFYSIWSTMHEDGHLIVAQTPTHRYETRNGGIRWQRTALSNPQIPQIIRPARRTAFLIDNNSTSSTGTVATSSNLGESWLAQTLPPDLIIPSGSTTPSGPERIWFTTADSLMVFRPQVHAFLTFDAQRRLHTTLSPLVAKRDRYQRRPGIRRLACHPRSSLVWYAQLEEGQLIRSLDGGRTWWSRGRKPAPRSTETLVGIIEQNGVVLLISRSSSRLDLFDITTPQAQDYPFRAGADLDPNLPIETDAPTLAKVGQTGPGGAEILVTGAEHITGLDVALDHEGVCFLSGAGRVLRLTGSPQSLDLIHTWDVADMANAQPASRIQARAAADRWFIPATTDDGVLGWTTGVGRPQPFAIAPPVRGRGRAWLDHAGILRCRQPWNSMGICHASADMGRSWMPVNTFVFGSGTPAVFDGFYLYLASQQEIQSIFMPGWSLSTSASINYRSAPDEAFAATVDVPGAGMLALTTKGEFVAFSAAGQTRVEAVGFALQRPLEQTPTALLSVHPRNAAVRYLAIPTTGILRSRDRGRTWSQLDPRHQASPDSPMAILHYNKRVQVLFVDHLGNLVALDETDPSDAAFPEPLRP